VVSDVSTCDSSPEFDGSSFIFIFCMLVIGIRDIFWTYLADHLSDDQDLASSVCDRVSVKYNAIKAIFV
jgi:hypothetical protein